MDFHTLTRRELQALCKKNKIPANLTNVAMADSLKALDIVDGIEEFLNNRSEFESEQAIIDTPIAPRTSCRSSARRVPINDDAVNSQILTRTRRGAKTVSGEGHENGKLDVPETPAAGQSCRRRAPIAPVRPKMEAQLEIEMEVEKKEQLIQAEEKKDVPETPLATTAHRLRATRSSARVVSVNQKVEASMSKVHSTRRTTRLIEPSLDGDDEIEPANLDDDNEEKEDIPSKVETPVVISEGVEELKEDIAEIITQDSVPSSQTMDVESGETEETKDDVSETEIDEVSGQTLNAEAEMDEDDEIVVSENSIEKLHENSEPSSQIMNVQFEETKDYVMNTENNEVSGQNLNAEAAMDEDKDEMKTNEGMGDSIAHLGDQFDKSLNLGDEKNEVAVKDYSICSLRQLKKQVKQIVANKGKKNAAFEEEEAVNARTALQDLSENSLMVENNSV